MTRTVGRILLLPAVAVLMLYGRAEAQPENSLGLIPDYQHKLDERINYESLVRTNLNTALDVLLTQNGIPWTVNRAAFVAAQQDKDVVEMTEIDKIDKRSGATRATILKLLLEKIPNDGGRGTPTYILRRSGVEITTMAAKITEARGERVSDPSEEQTIPFPPLAYAAFHGVPLEDALSGLADSTESTIVLDGRVSAQAKGKVTADLNGVPLDAAVELLADMTDLRLVRVANIYYVTSPQNADRLQKAEDRRRQELSGDAPPDPAPTPAPTAPAPPVPPAGPMAPAAPHSSVGRDRDNTAAPALLPSLTLTAVAPAPAPPAPPPAVEESSMGRILEFQKKLNERTDYELLVTPINLSLSLDQLLETQKIPWSVNKAAFTAAQMDRDTLHLTQINEKINKMTGVTRAMVLERLLSFIPNDGGLGAPTYILRRDYVEITTVGARIRETGESITASDAGDGAELPPLTYAAFEDAPLQDALKQLTRNTGSAVILDVRAAAKTKVTAELPGVPLDTALVVLADMADLKVVHIANVYYVTSPEHAQLLQKEADQRRLEREKGRPAPPQANGACEPNR